MGPENSEKKVYKVCMMVDGQPVEISPDIVEMTYSEEQERDNNLELGECEITMQEEYLPVPLIHGRMIYRCENCGKSWPMYLEKGIEEFGEDHKPSPFTIGCPYCGGLAMDVSGIQKVPGGGYVPLPDGYNYFANREDHRCGVPTFKAIAENEILGNSASMWIADIFDRIRSQEMEIFQEAMRKEQEQAEEIINRTVPDKAEEVKKITFTFAEKAGVSLKEVVAALLNAIRDFENSARAAFEPFLGEPDLAELEPGEPLDIPTAWDRKEAREKQQAVERAASSRFRKYKARESTWATRKRTGQRRREWCGPWRDKR